MTRFGLLSRKLVSALIVCALMAFPLTPGVVSADAPKALEIGGHLYDAGKAAGDIAIGYAQHAKLVGEVLNPEATAEVVQQAGGYIHHLEGVADKLAFVGDVVSIGTSVWDVVDTYKKEGLPAAFSTAMRETTKFVAKKGVVLAVGACVGGPVGIIAAAGASYLVGKAIDYAWGKSPKDMWEDAKALGRKAMDAGKALGGMVASLWDKSLDDGGQALAKGLLSATSNIGADTGVGKWALGELAREQALGQGGSDGANATTPFDPQSSPVIETAGKGLPNGKLIGTKEYDDPKGECVPYVREYFRGELPYLGANGPAENMYEAAKDAKLYVHPTLVREGAVMVFPADPTKKGMENGHVAVVTGVITNPDGTRTISVNESNVVGYHVVGSRTLIFDPSTNTAYEIVNGKPGASFNVTGFVHESEEVYQQKMAEGQRAAEAAQYQDAQKYKDAPKYTVPSYPDAPKYGH